MRTIVIKQNTDLRALSTMLMQPSAAGPQAELALNQVQALNPHVDIKALRPGAVLLIPDLPTINPAGTQPVASAAVEDLRQIIHDSLEGALERFKAGNAAAAADRTAIANVIKVAAFRRLTDSDPGLKQQVADATQTFKDEQKQDDADEKAVTDAVKAAERKLDELLKFLG